MLYHDLLKHVIPYALRNEDPFDSTEVRKAFCNGSKWPAGGEQFYTINKLVQCLELPSLTLGPTTWWLGHFPLSYVCSFIYNTLPVASSASIKMPCRERSLVWTKHMHKKLRKCIDDKSCRSLWLWLRMVHKQHENHSAAQTATFIQLVQPKLSMTGATCICNSALHFGRYSYSCA